MKYVILFILLVIYVAPLAAQDCQCDTLMSEKGFMYNCKETNAVKIADNRTAAVVACVAGMEYSDTDTARNVLILSIHTTKNRGSKIFGIVITAQDGSSVLLVDAALNQPVKDSNEKGRRAEYMVLYDVTAEQLATISKPLKELTVRFEGGDTFDVSIDHICTACALAGDK